jgi:hypothetical protein
MQITLETFAMRLLNGQLWSTYFPLHRKQKSICKIEHEATTSKIGEDQVFYCNQRGIPTEAIALIVNGFSKDAEQVTDGVCCGSAETIGNIS